MKLRSSEKSKKSLESMTLDEKGNLSGGYEKPPRQLYKIDTGVQRRIRLASEPVKIFFHKFNDEKVHGKINRGMPVICLKTLNEHCPICQIIDNVDVPDDSGPGKLKKKIRSYPDHFYNLIDRKTLKGKLDAGYDYGDPKGYSVEVIQVPFGQQRELQKIGKMWRDTPVQDPEEGLDLHITKEESASAAPTILYFPADGEYKRNDEGKKVPVYPFEKWGKYAITKQETKLPGWIGLHDPDDDDYEYENEKEVISQFLYSKEKSQYKTIADQLEKIFASGERKSSSYKDDDAPWDDEEEKPKNPKKNHHSRTMDDNDDEDEKPQKKNSTKRSLDNDDDDDRPGQASKKVDDERDDAPRRSKKVDDDEDELPPKKSSKKNDDDEEDDRPKKSSKRVADDDDDDDSPPLRKNKSKLNDDRSLF